MLQTKSNDVSRTGEMGMPQKPPPGHFGQMQKMLDEDTLAEGLGITTDELQSYYDEGKSIPEIAGELGKSPEEMKTIMADAMEAGVNKALESGEINATQADKMLERVEGMRSGEMRPPPFGGPPPSRGAGSQATDTQTDLTQWLLEALAKSQNENYSANTTDTEKEELLGQLVSLLT